MQAKSETKSTHIYALENFSTTPDEHEQNTCNLWRILLSKNAKNYASVDECSK